MRWSSAASSASNRLTAIRESGPERGRFFISECTMQNAEWGGERDRCLLPTLSGCAARPHGGPDGLGRALVQAEHRGEKRACGDEPGDPAEADGRGQGIAGRVTGGRAGLAEGEREGGVGRGGSAHGGGAGVRQEARVVGGVARGVRVEAAGDGAQPPRGVGADQEMVSPSAGRALLCQGRAQGTSRERNRYAPCSRPRRSAALPLRPQNR